MDNPITTVAYGNNYLRNQELSVASMSLSPKLNDQGTGSIVVPINSSAQEFLGRPGERVICTYRDELLMTGVISDPAGTILPGGLVSYSVLDDWRILENSLAVVAPRNHIVTTSTIDLGQAWQTTTGSAGTTQGQVGYFIFPASVTSAESAIKHLITENIVERLGRPVRVGPDLGRGGDARAAGLLDVSTVRMISVAEAIAPILEFSKLKLSVVQQPGDLYLTIDVEESPTWPTVLSLDAGMLNDGTWSQGYPTATRVIVGGPGDGPARAYYSVIDSALEARYNDVIEVFADATNVTLEWPSNLATALQVPKYAAFREELTAAQRATFLAGLKAAGRTALAAGSETSSVSMTLAETDSFHFHGEDGIHVGTLVDVKSGPLEFSDRLTGATVAVGDNGLEVTPSLGQISDDEDDEIWSALERLATSLRKTKTQR